MTKKCHILLQIILALFICPTSALSEEARILGEDLLQNPVDRKFLTEGLNIDLAFDLIDPKADFDDSMQDIQFCTMVGAISGAVHHHVKGELSNKAFEEGTELYSYAFSSYLSQEEMVKVADLGQSLMEANKKTLSHAPQPGSLLLV